MVVHGEMPLSLYHCRLVTHLNARCRYNPAKVYLGIQRPRYKTFLIPGIYGVAIRQMCTGKNLFVSSNLCTLATRLTI